MKKRFTLFKNIAGLKWDKVQGMFKIGVENSKGKVLITLSEDDKFKIYNTFPDETFSSDGLVPFELLGCVSDEIEKIHSFIRKGIGGKVYETYGECLLETLSASGFKDCVLESGAVAVPFKGGIAKFLKISTSMARGHRINGSVSKDSINNSCLFVEIESGSPIACDVKELCDFIGHIKELSSDIVEI
jgi:hypothetical protein